MESQRSILIIGLLLVSFLLWIEYQETYGPQPVQTAEQLQQDIGVTDVPVDAATLTESDTFIPKSDETNALPTPQTNSNTASIVNVVTDTLTIKINPVGGDIIEANLVQYPLTQGSDDSYPLLSPNSATLYTATSGLIGKNGIDDKGGRPRYIVSRDTFEMTEDTLDVPLTFISDTGLVVTKTFTFTRGSHAINVNYSIQNNTGTTATLQQFAQLKQTTAERASSSMFMPTYRGAAYSTQNERYEKYSFADIEDENLNVSTIGGWVGMLEHYFVSAWVPPQTQTNKIYSRLNNSNNAIIGFTGTPIVIEAGDTSTLSSTLYVGPKDQDTLAGLARGLDLTVDYGFLWWIAQPLFSILKWIHSVVSNWGLAIILITLLVKGAMYYLTKKQYESMAKMRALSPKLQQLKDRFGDDRQKMSQAMMTLYKKEKVNPMGGCLPLLLQMPLFLALYWVLLESVELRHADFALWITDLSVKDPFFVLPILTGLSMWFLQKLQPMTVQDPLQQKIFQFMPIAMTVFFMFFPAGLVLYWLISNLVTLVQAKMIYASMEKRGLKTR